MSVSDVISLDSRIDNYETSSAGEEGDEVSSLASPVMGLESSSNTTAPSWIQELNRSRVTRHSRASSIISTRTKFSTTTHDDARSIDINVGGHYFRISRDGSRISDDPRLPDAPPPYFDTRSNLGSRFGDSSSLTRHSDIVDEDVNEGQLTPTRRTSESNINSGIRADILDPSEREVPSPTTGEQSDHLATPHVVSSSAGTEALPARNHSYKSGPEILSISSEARRSRTVSYDDLPGPSTRASDAIISLKRWNGVRLPKLITTNPLAPIGSSIAIGSDANATIGIISPSSDQDSQKHTKSAGPILLTTSADDASLSPTFIGRNATATFPLPRSQPITLPDPDPSGSLNQDQSDVSDVATVTEGQDTLQEGNTPLPMDSENDISLHYTRLIRRLDRDHRKALHLKDKELAEYRVRLNEMDTVYRQELRARDFIIDDLKKRLDHLEENSETRVEKARNQVEDLWESRWKDRDFHLRERMRRMEEEAQRTIDDLLKQIPLKTALDE